MHEKNHACRKISIGESNALRSVWPGMELFNCGLVTCPNLDTLNKQCHGL
jgi:hypothetical protein